MKKEKDKYIMYLRKSSEEDNRQILSIESQETELNRLAKNLNLKIYKTIKESKSAKDPGRPGFDEMILDIKEGKFNGIICWKIDRLSRNPIDSANIQWLLQKEKLNSIQTMEKRYLPSDNAIIFNVESGMANQYVLDLSKNVKRGLKTKAEKGWFPGIAKPGYLNDKYCEQGERKILEDPNTLPLIKKSFEMLLTGLYRPSQILDKLNNEWGYRSHARKTTGGKPLSRSTFYDIISDPFYYGKYEFPLGSGNWYQGKHKAIISKDEFYKIQEIIGKKNNSRPRIKDKESALYGLFRCYECNSIITPDTKIQTICTKCKTKFSSKRKDFCPNCNTKITNMKNPTQLKYIYYGCSKKGKNCQCKSSIEEREIDKQILEKLNNIKISEDIKNWYLEQLEEANKSESEEQILILENLQKEQTNYQKKIHNLLQLKISPNNTNGEILNDYEFSRENEKLREELNKIELRIVELKNRTENWTNLAIKTFNFACYAKHHYENGSIEDKKSILIGLSSNLIIKDKKVLISLPKHLELIESGNNKIKELKIKFEPTFTPINKERTGFLQPVRSTLLGDRDSNPNSQDQNLESYR